MFTYVIKGEKERLIIRNWLTQLWRLASPKFCSIGRQPGDPGEPMVQGKSDSSGLEKLLLLREVSLLFYSGLHLIE